MSKVKGMRAGLMASILAGAALAAGVAQAQGVSTERPGSILIFPKVVNGDVDTLIQITNSSNSLTYAHCFYVNGASYAGEPLWQVTDFEIALTRQQPTHWMASEGRAVNPLDSEPGLDPGLVPPIVPGFTGFLTCVETLSDGTPVSSNSLIGTAEVGSRYEVSANAASNGVVMSKYNAVAIPGCNSENGPCGPSGAANDGNDVLALNNVEYAQCPGGLYLNFESEGGSDLAIDGADNVPSTVSTNLSLVPCGMDFENLVPTSTTLSAEIRDEFEARTSVSQIDVDCYFEAALSDPVFGSSFALSSSQFGTAILRPTAGSGLAPVVGIANVLRTAGDGSSDTAATNLHFCTEENAPSSCVGVDTEIRLPSTFVPPPRPVK